MKSYISWSSCASNPPPKPICPVQIPPNKEPKPMTYTPLPLDQRRKRSREYQKLHGELEEARRTNIELSKHNETMEEKLQKLQTKLSNIKKKRMTEPVAQLKKQPLCSPGYPMRQEQELIRKLVTTEDLKFQVRNLELKMKAQASDYSKLKEQHGELKEENLRLLTDTGKLREKLSDALDKCKIFQEKTAILEIVSGELLEESESQQKKELDFVTIASNFMKKLHPELLRKRKSIYTRSRKKLRSESDDKGTEFKARDVTTSSAPWASASDGIASVTNPGRKEKLTKKLNEVAPDELMKQESLFEKMYNFITWRRRALYFYC